MAVDVARGFSSLFGIGAVGDSLRCWDAMRYIRGGLARNGNQRLVVVGRSAGTMVVRDRRKGMVLLRDVGGRAMRKRSGREEKRKRKERKGIRRSEGKRYEIQEEERGNSRQERTGKQTPQNKGKVRVG